MSENTHIEFNKLRYEFEDKFLSRYAAKSCDAVRSKPVTYSEIRTDYQRDRDRIIHSKSFRRLKHKTQVFLSPEGDHYRTRLTHTLEVSQIARTIARALRLNEDLTEAIALGHDLGHTPFGHAGERTLDKLSGHFAHNEQSLRVVELLENDGEGLNLTDLVKDGILNHCSKGVPKSLEGKVVSWSDRIAYINHDIEDGITAGLLKEEDIPDKFRKLLGTSKGARINNMVCDIVYNSYDKDYVSPSDEFKEGIAGIRQFMFDNLYFIDAVKGNEARSDRMIKMLFDYHTDKAHFDELPEFYQQVAERDGIVQAVTDYIASMTDTYAMRLFETIYLPTIWKG